MANCQLRNGYKFSLQAELFLLANQTTNYDAWLIKIYLWKLTNEIRQKLAFLTLDGITCWQPHPSEMNNLKFKVPPYFCIVRSVLTSKVNSSASASSSSVILTEGDLCNRPVLVRAESRLKYRAICCSVNQSVLENIFWPVSSLELFVLGATSEAVVFLPVSSPVQNESDKR